MRPRPSMPMLERRTIRCTGIPQKMNIGKIVTHFMKFGRLVRYLVKVDEQSSIQRGITDPEREYNQFLGLFSSHEEARDCLSSPEAIGNNRFIRTMWADANLEEEVPGDSKAAGDSKVSPHIIKMDAEPMKKAVPAPEAAQSNGSVEQKSGEQEVQKGSTDTLPSETQEQEDKVREVEEREKEMKEKQKQMAEARTGLEELRKKRMSILKTKEGMLLNLISSSKASDGTALEADANTGADVSKLESDLLVGSSHTIRSFSNFF